MPTATLLVSCPDQQGLVAKIANFIYANGGNIIHADQHTDLSAGLFLTRIEWELDGFNLPREVIEPAFGAIAKPLGATYSLHFSDQVPGWPFGSPNRITVCWICSGDNRQKNSKQRFP